MRPISEKTAWNHMMDSYLKGVDHVWQDSKKFIQERQMWCVEFQKPSSKTCAKWSLVVFLVAMAIFCVSCQKSAHGLEKQSDQLYIRRDGLEIHTKELGSSTGSLWADSSTSQDLITQSMPNHVGAFITVQIPKNLQWTPEVSEAQSNKTPPTAGTPPLPTNSMDSIKMEVVQYNAGGVAIVRGKEDYTDPKSGVKSEITVTAEVPVNQLLTETLSATALANVTVAQRGDKTGIYNSMGWDTTVSRMLDNYVPDMSQIQKIIDGQEQAMAQEKSNLQDQKKMLDETSSRLKADRARLATDQKQFQNKLQNTLTAMRAQVALNQPAKPQKSHTGSTPATNNENSGGANSTPSAPPISGG